MTKYVNVFDHSALLKRANIYFGSSSSPNPRLAFEIHTSDSCLIEISEDAQTIMHACDVNTFEETTHHQGAWYWNYA